MLGGGGWSSPAFVSLEQWSEMQGTLVVNQASECGQKAMMEAPRIQRELLCCTALQLREEAFVF